MTLEQIRDKIERDSFGKLLPDEIVETTQAIEAFKNTHHYLPNDIDDWYEDMQQYVYDYEMAMDNIGGDWEG